MLGLMKLGVVREPRQLAHSRQAAGARAPHLRAEAHRRRLGGAWPVHRDPRRARGRRRPSTWTSMPEHRRPGGHPLWSDRLPAGASRDPVDTVSRTMGDLAAYLYTSGTTGTPKAALVKHHRLFRAGRVFGGIRPAAGRRRRASTFRSRSTTAPRSGRGQRERDQLRVDHRPGPSILRQHVLGGLPEVRRHSLPLRRRVVSVPPRRSAASASDRDHSDPRDLRQRPAAGHLGALPGALRDRAHRRVLRVDRGQRRDDEPRRPCPDRSARCCPGRRSCAGTRTRQDFVRGADGRLQFAARREKWASCSARSPTAAGSTATRTAPRPRARSFAGRSSRPMHGSTPAT